jgi:hypothetical protein
MGVGGYACYTTGNDSSGNGVGTTNFISFHVTGSPTFAHPNPDGFCCEEDLGSGSGTATDTFGYGAILDWFYFAGGGTMSYGWTMFYGGETYNFSQSAPLGCCTPGGNSGGCSNLPAPIGDSYFVMCNNSESCTGGIPDKGCSSGYCDSPYGCCTGLWLAGNPYADGFCNANW